MTGMHGHIGPLFTHHFYPLTPLFCSALTQWPHFMHQFLTISHQMTPFLSVYLNFHLFFNFFSQMCPNLYFAWKIGKNVYNSHSLTPAFIDQFLRKISHRKAPKRYWTSIHVPHHFRGWVPPPQVPGSLNKDSFNSFYPPPVEVQVGLCRWIQNLVLPRTPKPPAQA